MDAVSAVTAFVRDHGVTVEAPVLLRSTNNIVAWLAPSNIVAKIAVNNGRAEDERAVAEFLSARGAPVVPPSITLGDRVHTIEGHDVTFWTYVPHSSTSPTSASVAAALAELHDHMRTLGQHLNTSLRSCHEVLSHTLLALDRQIEASQLSADDRRVLTAALDRGCDALTRRRRDQPIHGSPHRFNIVADTSGPKFIDFESVATGPIEWDIAHLEPEVGEHYQRHVDHDLLDTLRVAVSAMTSAWCWDAVHRGPDMIEHARHHLAIVREHTSSM